MTECKMCEVLSTIKLECKFISKYANLESRSFTNLHITYTNPNTSNNYLQFAELRLQTILW